MTEKIYPEALIPIDFQFEASDIKRLQTASGATFTRKIVQELTLAFGTYLAGTLLFWHGALPKEAGETLETTRKTLTKLSEIFKKLCGIDGSDALSIGGLGLTPEIFDLPFEAKKEHGLLYIPSYAETGQDIDQHLAVGNLIDYQLGLVTNNEIDLAYVYGILQITLDSMQDAKETIRISRGKGGRVGDPNFTVFLIDLINIIYTDLDMGSYESKTIDFIDEARQIVAERLEKMGEKKASEAVLRLEKDNILRRIQDAREEDSRTYQRSRVKGPLTQSQPPGDGAGNQR
jgi:hypothetical protein